MITSRSNPLIKRIRRLQQKKHRLKEGAGFVEGLRSALAAVETVPQLVERVVIAPELLKSDVAERRLAELLPDLEPDLLSADLFQSLSQRDNAVGLGVIVRSPLRTLSGFQPKKDRPLLILDRISDPGNLGTILRTADGVGVGGVLLCGSGADLLNPTAVKASMGTVFVHQVAHMEHAELLAWLKAEGLPLVATSAKAEMMYDGLSLPDRFALMLGNEGEGLDRELQAAADHLIKIPMRGHASSLNVSVAAGIMLYQLIK